MIDINFFMKVHELKQKIMGGYSFEKGYVFNELERHRSREPVIYNIETTNACNMKCEMCPRTTLMTRRIETLDQGIFENIVDQIRSKKQLKEQETIANKHRAYDRDTNILMQIFVTKHSFY